MDNNEVTPDEQPEAAAEPIDEAIDSAQRGDAHRIMMVGGGSGGHLSPLVAVGGAVKAAEPDAQVSFVGQRGENLQEFFDPDVVDTTFSISAGKFRRYHGESFLSHLLDFKTIALNIRDVFRFAAGTVQAWRLLGRYRPDVILLKGGFVCVPVGIAARWRKIPYITHDSDVVPGLANRITSKHARYNTTAMPTSHYPYEKSKAIQVGIPLRKEFEYVSDDDTKQYKTMLEIDPDHPVLFCFGGGLGAHNLNKALVAVSADLLGSYPELEIIHFSGKGPFTETKNLYHKALSEELYNRVRVIDFHTDVYTFSGASDVIVARAGATGIAEFALQGKPCIFVPGPQLTGGQQIENAKALEKAEAALVVSEDDTTSLRHSIHHLLDSEPKRRQLSENIQKVSFAGSAKKLADILLEIARG